VLWRCREIMLKSSHLFLQLAAANGFIVVVLGAFGAHGLEQFLPAAALDTWQTAVQYHMFHVTGLLAVSVVERLFVKSAALWWSGIAFLAGVLLFSGSLYVLAVTGVRWLGMITPIGGACFLLGWGLLFKVLVSHKV
jgi:uncharacterized membrane protein YgdD (TMEM256/DUF423 family)